MRIKIEIDDDLVSEAFKVNGSKTMKETLEEGLKLFIQRISHAMWPVLFSEMKN